MRRKFDLAAIVTARIATLYMKACECELSCGKSRDGKSVAVPCRARGRAMYEQALTSLKYLTYSYILLESDISFSNTGSNILPHHEDTYSTTYSTLHTVRQHVFTKQEFHYLNVSRVGAFTVYDIFDCTIQCLTNPLCFSVNLATSKGANGKLWCELLSSDKFRNFTQYKGNKTSHHFSIKVGNILLACLLLLLACLLVCLLAYLHTFCSRLVLPRRVKTEEPVYQTTNMTRLNASVKRTSLENIVKKVPGVYI